jgi:hypothetical protein
MRVAALLAVVAALCACGAASSGRADEERDLSAYTGLATWVDLYDPHVLKRPESSVAAMAENGVRTLFFETSNYQMRRDIVRPDRVARFVEARAPHRPAAETTRSPRDGCRRSVSGDQLAEERRRVRHGAAGSIARSSGRRQSATSVCSR